MRLLVVIEREVRCQARRPASYWLRMVAAGLLILVFGAVAKGPGQLYGADLGEALFAVSNGVIHYLIWLGVPLLVADAISREKRDGTLGLLFLTPLTAWDIVLGKAVTFGWQAVALLLAGVPVLVLPFTVGGVSLPAALFLLAVHAISLLAALAAGLAASAMSRRPARAVTAALLCSGGLSLLFNAGLQLALGGDLDEALFGPAVLANVLRGASSGGLTAGAWLGCGFLVALGLVTAVALACRTVWQIQEFWREAPVTTDRVQRAARGWLRLLGLLAALLLAAGWVVLWINDPTAALPVGLAVANGLALLAVCGGAVAWVFRDGDAAGQKAGGRAPGIDGRRAGPDAGPGRWRPGWLERFVLGVLVLLVTAAVAGVAPWRGVIAAALNQASAAFLALGVARLAWAWGRSWMRAMVRLPVVALLPLLLWLTLLGLALGHVTVESGMATSMQETLRHGWPFVVLVGGLFGSGAFLGFGADPVLRLDATWLVLDALGVLLASAVGSLALWLAGSWFGSRARRPRAAEDPGASLVQDFAEPLFARAWLRRRKVRVLERNPMRWVFERSRLHRLRRLGWLALVVVAETTLAFDLVFMSVGEIWLWQGVLLLALLVGLSFAAVLSFQEEKRNGALELILVTPLTVAQIVRGRWWGLVGQFLPALGLFAFVCSVVPLGRWSDGRQLGIGPAALGLLVAAGVIYSVSMVGMLCACRLRHLAAAWIVTAAVAVGNAVLLGVVGVAGSYLGRSPNPAVALVFALVLNLVAGKLASTSLARTLSRRELRW